MILLTAETLPLVCREVKTLFYECLIDSKSLLKVLLNLLIISYITGNDFNINVIVNTGYY